MKVKTCKITTCEFYETCHRKEKQPRPGILNKCKYRHLQAIAERAEAGGLF
jgi:hypothetical protein